MLVSLSVYFKAETNSRFGAPLRVEARACKCLTLATKAGERHGKADLDRENRAELRTESISAQGLYLLITVFSKPGSQPGTWLVLSRPD